MANLGAVVNDNATPEPALYGLLSSAVRVINDSSTHWMNGIQYENLECSADVKLTSICNRSAEVTALEASDNAIGAYDPFNIQTSFSCSTMSRRPEEVEDILNKAAEACIQKAIEREFWTGELAKVAAEDWPDGDEAYPNRYLASDAAVDVTPDAFSTGVKAKYAVALLEKALGDCGCGGRGTLHLTRDVASSLGLKAKGDHLETNLGNAVVAGVGYTGSGPDGSPAPAGKAWAYATGPVTVRLSNREIYEDTESQSTVNTTTYIADQVAAVTWNACCHVAVLVDLSLDYS